jgi:hypothetical protein
VKTAFREGKWNANLAEVNGVKILAKLLDEVDEGVTGRRLSE